MSCGENELVSFNGMLNKHASVDITNYKIDEGKVPSNDNVDMKKGKILPILEITNEINVSVI